MKFKERFIQQRRDFAELMKHYPFTTETLAGEEWRDIEGTDGKYQVSNYSRVKRFCNGEVKILKPSISPEGYTFCSLTVNRKKKMPKVHRLVAEAFIPNPDNKPYVNHIDGCKWNNCASNLEWVTHSENVRHADASGLRELPRGEEHRATKITDEQVLYIRENPDKLNTYQLGEKFGVDPTTIGNIQMGRSHRHVVGKIRTKIEAKLSHKDYEEVYHLYQTGNYQQKQLAEMFGVGDSSISYAIKKIDEKLGSYVRPRKFRSIPNEVRKQIRAEYIKGSTEYGSHALAKKYGCNASTIINIVHEDDQNYKPRVKKTCVPDKIREQIRAEYIKGDPQFGIRPLARKYGHDRSTIKKIINEK